MLSLRPLTIATLLMITAGCETDTKDGDSNKDDASVIEDSAEPTDADPHSERIDMVLSLTGRASTGAALYRSSCSNCHDAEGEAVPNKGVRVRDAVERIGRRAVVRRLITGAGDYRTDEIFMPSFASLADSNLADLLLHLESGFSSDSTNDP